jgi:hypothetical protein
VSMVISPQWWAGPLLVWASALVGPLVEESLLGIEGPEGNPGDRAGGGDCCEEISDAGAPRNNVRGNARRGARGLRAGTAQR